MTSKNRMLCIETNQLRARNVLVSNVKIVQISNFGLARKVSEDLIYVGKTECKLPLKWMSPESTLNEVFTV